MLKRLKIAPHKHSGKIRPHEFTSYLPLGALLMVVGLLLGVYTVNATDHPAPQAASVGISGVMPGAPPTVAATIDSPSDGQRFSSTPVTVTGTCPSDTLVEIFKSDIFAGSTSCSSDGKYSIDIDLLIGANTLLARVYDALNQAGPDSNTPVVIYDALPSQTDALTSLNLDSSQLLVNTSAVFRGVFPDKELVVPITILSGSPAYAINVQWGDSENNVYSRDNNSTFNATHTYTKAGTYQITIQVTDSTGKVAFLSVTAVVNGQVSTVISSTTDTNSTSNSIISKLLVLWPLYAAAVATVISFWLGEQREKRILRLRELLLSSR